MSRILTTDLLKTYHVDGYQQPEPQTLVDFIEATVSKPTEQDFWKMTPDNKFDCHFEVEPNGEMMVTTYPCRQTNTHSETDGGCMVGSMRINKTMLCAI